MSCPFSPGKKHLLKDMLSRFSFRKKRDMSSEASLILSAVLDSTSDAIICITDKATVTLFNRAAERMFGYKREEVLGKNIKMLMPESFATHHDEFISSYLRTGRKKIIDIGREVVGKKKDGTEFPLGLAVSEVFIGKTRLFTGRTLDLSLEKKAKELAEKEMRLEEEEKVKNDFLTSMSHELRTPLHAIMGFVECLEQGMDGPLVPAQKESLGRVSAASKHLLGLINGLLMLSKLTRPDFSKEKGLCDLAEVVRFCIDMTGVLADKKNIELITDFPDELCLVEGNEEGLCQVFLNILGNAVKFTEKGSVRITIEASKKTATISIKDTGIGIEEKHLSHIFFPLSRPFLSTSSKREQGGLGLAITKTLVEVLGGSITATSEVNVGTEFVVILPIKQGRESGKE